MGILVKQDNSQDSELRSRITAELREKAEKSSNLNPETPDGVNDAKYVEGYKQTGRFAWFWVLLLIGGFVGILAYLVF